MNNHKRKTHIDDLFICSLCDFRSVSSKLFELHLKRKHKEGAKILFHNGKYHCDACEFHSEKQSEIRTHRITKHTVSLISCQLCAFPSKSEKDLVLHIEAIHMGVKFLCYICDSKATKRHISMANVPTNTVNCGVCAELPYFAYLIDGFKKRI